MAPEKPASSSYATDGSCSSIELRRQSPHQKLQFASSDRARRAGAFLYVTTNVRNSSGSIRSTSSQHPSQDSAPIVVRTMQLANHDICRTPKVPRGRRGVRDSTADKTDRRGQHASQGGMHAGPAFNGLTFTCASKARHERSEHAWRT